MSKDKQPYIYILISGILWGAIGVTVRLLASFGLTNIQIVVTRFFTVSMVFAAYIFFTDKSKFKIEKKDIKYFAAFGVCCLFAYNITFAVTTRLASLSIAVALLYTSPIWAMLLSIPIFKEKLTKSKALAIFLSFLGCALISGLFSAGGLLMPPLALLTGLLSGIGYASYGVIAKKLLQKYDSMTTMFYPFLFASITGAFFSKMGDMAGIIVNAPIVLLYIFAGAFICFVIPYGLYTYALNFTEASRAAVIVSIEPVSATIIGLVLYNEPVTLVSAAGIFCILSAIFILNRNDGRNEPDSGEIGRQSQTETET